MGVEGRRRLRMKTATWVRSCTFYLKSSAYFEQRSTMYWSRGYKVTAYGDFDLGSFLYISSLCMFSIPVELTRFISSASVFRTFSFQMGLDSVAAMTVARLDGGIAGAARSSYSMGVRFRFFQAIPLRCPKGLWKFGRGYVLPIFLM